MDQVKPIMRFLGDMVLYFCAAFYWWMSDLLSIVLPMGDLNPGIRAAFQFLFGAIILVMLIGKAYHMLTGDRLWKRRKK